MLHGFSHLPVLFAFCLLACVPPLCFAIPIKAVNLGNWLIIEGGNKPSLFDGIPNKDLLDGTLVQFKSTKLQKYLCADQNIDGSPLVASQSSASDWETFRLWRINETFFNLRLSNKKFVGLDCHGIRVVATSPTDSPDTVFQIIRNDGDPNRVRLRASNGHFLQARSESLVTADYHGSGWEDENPSVFIMTVNTALRGDYQIANGYGPEKAPQVMQEHWNTYITDEDFRFMSENGLDTVRIPVGWWLAHDPTPPKPFVGGSLQALDNAFTWAEKYGMKVIADLHAVPGAQNDMEFTGTRDGFQEWGDSYLDETVAVIDFLAARYANRSGLLAIELVNEPLAPGVDLDFLKRYYQAGYDAVRKYTQDAYVILSIRIHPQDVAELIPFASGLSRVVLDLHCYNMFSSGYDYMGAEWNIYFVSYYHGSLLRKITTENGPLSFIGEWSGEWKVRDASKEQYKRFVKAQQEVFGTATFGWGYWTYKSDMNHWSLKWMIENNYLNVTYSNQTSPYFSSFAS